MEIISRVAKYLGVNANEPTTEPNPREVRASMYGIHQMLFRGDRGPYDNADIPPRTFHVTFNYNYSEYARLMHQMASGMSKPPKAERSLIRQAFKELGEQLDVTFKFTKDNMFAGPSPKNLIIVGSDDSMGKDAVTMVGSLSAREDSPDARSAAKIIRLGSKMSGTMQDEYFKMLVKHEALHALGIKHPQQFVREDRGPYYRGNIDPTKSLMVAPYSKEIQKACMKETGDAQKCRELVGDIEPSLAERKAVEEQMKRGYKGHGHDSPHLDAFESATTSGARSFALELTRTLIKGYAKPYLIESGYTNTQAEMMAATMETIAEYASYAAIATDHQSAIAGFVANKVASNIFGSLGMSDRQASLTTACISGAVRGYVEGQEFVNMGAGALGGTAGSACGWAIIRNLPKFKKEPATIERDPATQETQLSSTSSTPGLKRVNVRGTNTP